jgi:hypothetical protein
MATDTGYKAGKKSESGRSQSLACFCTYKGCNGKFISRSTYYHHDQKSKSNESWRIGGKSGRYKGMQQRQENLAVQINLDSGVAADRQADQLPRTESPTISEQPGNGDAREGEAGIAPDGSTELGSSPQNQGSSVEQVETLTCQVDELEKKVTP